MKMRRRAGVGLVIGSPVSCGEPFYHFHVAFVGNLFDFEVMFGAKEFKDYSNRVNDEDVVWMQGNLGMFKETKQDPVTNESTYAIELFIEGSHYILELTQSEIHKHICKDENRINGHQQDKVESEKSESN